MEYTATILGLYMDKDLGLEHRLTTAGLHRDILAGLFRLQYVWGVAIRFSSHEIPVYKIPTPYVMPVLSKGGFSTGWARALLTVHLNPAVVPSPPAVV